MQNKNTYTIVVLNDGQTFSSIDGCQILTITENAMKLLENGDLNVTDIVYSRKEEIVACVTLL